MKHLSVSLFAVAVLAYGGWADDEHTTTGGAVADLVAAADGQLQLDPSDASGDGFRGELVRFTGKTDRPPLSYRAGEKMRFVFSVSFNQKVPAGRVFFVHWYRKGDDEICRSGFERIEEGRPVVVETSIDRPGFVNVDATLVDVDGRSFAYFPDGRSRVGTRWNGGAGADVGKLLPSVPEPEDFDAFWAKHLAALEKLPLNVKYKDVPAELVPEKFRGTRKVRVFSADCLGPRPCTASIAIPTGAKAKSLPIFASFDGYGEGPKGEPPDAWLYVDEPCVRVHVNAHGYELLREKAYYEAFFRENPNYAMGYDEYRNAETCYLYGMALRAVRALDVAKAQPEWDGREIRLVGSSQGGAQAIWAASLARGVTSARVSVTWMCDVGSVTAGRMRGMFPDYHGPMRYFDAVFHARRIPESCTVTISKAGLGDLTCPPAGQACLFNAINGPKSIDWIQNSTHLFTPHVSVREHWEVSRQSGSGVATGDASSICRLRTVRAVKTSFDAKAWTIAADGQEPKPFDFRPRTNLRSAGGTAEKKLPPLSWVTVRGTLVAEADGEAVVGAGFDWWWECLVNGTRVFGRLPGNGSTAHSGCLPTDWPFAVPVRRGANEVTFRVLLGGAGRASADALNGTVTVDDRFVESYRASLGRHETPGPAAATYVRLGADKAGFATSQPHPAGLAYRTKGTKAWKEAWDLRSAKDHVVALPPGTWECELLEWRDDGQAWELLRRPCALTADDRVETAPAAPRARFNWFDI